MPRKTVTDIMLLGAGHAHVEVLRRHAINPAPGLRYTLVAREPRTPYSGMLPGVIRGDYTPEQASIDCAALAAAAGARLVLAEAEEIDLRARRVHAAGAASAAFDLLSVNVGGVPRMPPGAGIGVKPIGRFLAQFATLEPALRRGDPLAVIGGGAGGTELALALATRSNGQVILVSGRDPPLADAPERVRAFVGRVFAARGIDVVREIAERYANRTLTLADGRRVFAACALWATGVAAPEFLAASGLAWDRDGCIRTSSTLRSISHDFVFAAGDCAAIDFSPHPKAGVWAVRAGPPLARNLVLAAQGRPLRSWSPQASGLVILGLGGGRAVAWRRNWTLTGRLAWIWKDRIDRGFMRKYQALRAPL